MDNYNYNPEENNNNENQQNNNPKTGTDGWQNPYSNLDNSSFRANRPQQKENSTDGFAVASLVLGILSIPAVITVYFGIIFGVSAIVMAIISRSNTNHRFNGLALGGLICGIIGIALVIIIVVLIINFLSNPEIMRMVNELMDEYRTV